MTGPHCLVNIFREIRQLHLQRWPCLLGSNCPLSRIGGVCPLPNPAPSRSLCVDFHSRQELLTLLPSLCANLFAFVLHVEVHKCTRMWRSAAGAGCLPRLLSARYIGLSHLTPCSHSKTSTHLSRLPAPRLHPLLVWLFSSSGYCCQSQRRFLKHLHAFHMLEPGITQITGLFSFLYLKV